jgi:hypothetical protein
MKAIIASLTMGACLIVPVSQVFAGQPNASCGAPGATMTPGHSGFPSNTGSPFAEGHSGTVYAGSGPGSAHANSPNAVSQYDIACVHVTAQAP